jgi:hypothetical protein
MFAAPSILMSYRLRHYVECPKRLTRYLVASSPYGNGSYLSPMLAGSWEAFILYCSCGTPRVCSRWSSSELKRCAVSKLAYDRGYGTREEIAPINSNWQAAETPHKRLLNVSPVEEERD